MRTTRHLAPWHLFARRNVRAFTMIEIAISLAVIGFALVAIIGILPTGMSAQRENREDTIINQDASIFLQAIRNGEAGLDELTNSVLAITNWRTVYRADHTFVSGPHMNYFTRTNSSYTPTLLLTNGYRIVGLLSTPKYLPYQTNQYLSNYTVAIVRSMSGLASEKVPQTNSEVQELALTYRLLPDVVPFSEFDTNWVYYQDPAITANVREVTRRSNYWRQMVNLQTNLWDVRLRFQWPVLPAGKLGDGRQAYRSLVSGTMLYTNDYTLPVHALFLFEPRNYVLGK